MQPKLFQNVVLTQQKMKQKPTSACCGEKKKSSQCCSNFAPHRFLYVYTSTSAPFFKIYLFIFVWRFVFSQLPMKTTLDPFQGTRLILYVSY